MSFDIFDDHLSAGAYQEVLLVYTQFSSGFIGIIRVKEQGQVFFNVVFIKVDAVFFDDGFGYSIQIEQKQLVFPAGIADDIHTLQMSFNVHIAKMNRIGFAGVIEPGLSSHPWIRKFFLFAVFELLMEQAEMVVQTYAVAWKFKSSDRIKEACSKTSKSAVS